jgi:uncharacterized protein (TIGR03435 family)
MKHYALLTVALLALTAGALQAQDLTGTWQGTIMTVRDLRMVIKISNADGGELLAVLYSIDQSPQPIASRVTLEGSTVKVSVAAAGVTYEGRLSADGNTITGNWMQGSTSLPLNLTRATSETAWALPAAPVPPKPMAADASPAFEVATIKPSKPETQGKGVLVRGRQFSTVNMTVSDLMTFAYGVHTRQISGPEWLETEKYDVVAQPDAEGQPNDKQWKVMVQKLLADRFMLTFHRDKQELPVYAIVTAKTGSKLTRSQGDPNGLPGMFFRGLGVLPAVNASIADLAGVLQTAVLDRPVVDQTGITGRYDFTLTWTPDESQFAGLGIRVPPPAANAANAPPGLFTAIQEQLGLRLESTKAPVDVLVVDRAEKPSAN